MKLGVPQDYAIELSAEGSYRLFSQEMVCTFSKPASVGKLAKLYTLSDAGHLIYVGIAEQAMASRLSYGFRANGKSGYYGYKWKGLRHRLSLTVWTATENNEHVPVRELETIEAEVAFLCRKQSGQWPAYQHEIHFYPSNSCHRQAAEVIYAHAIQRRG